MRLDGGVFRELEPAAARGGRRLHSAVLGPDMRAERDGALRMRNPVIGEELLTYDEEHDGRRAAEIRAREEAAAREAAEARVAELEALVREMQDGRRTG